MVNGLEPWEEERLRGVTALARDLGLTRVRLSGLEVEIGPVPIAPAPPAHEEKPEPPARTCGCPHPVEDHGEAGCLHGCSLETCAGSGQHPQPEMP